MNFFVLFLGIVFMGVGFAIPLLADCGLGSIGLILLGLVGVAFRRFSV